MEKISKIKYRVVGSALIVAGFIITTPDAIAQTATPETQTAVQNHLALDTLVKPIDIPRNDEITLLKERFAAQQAELTELKKVVEEQRRLLETVLQNKARSTTAEAIVARGPAAPEVGQSNAVASTSASPVTDVSQPNKIAVIQQQEPSPLTFKIGNAYLTPFGYFDLTAVIRDKNVGSGITTNFGAVPFNNTVNGNLREYQLSAQNARFGMRVDAKFKGFDVLGYLETDFNGFAPGNVAVSTHSDSLRLRLGFVDVRKKKFEILVGQAFGMLTPNRKGLSPVPADVFTGQGLDSSVHVGLPWTRSPQFRLIYHATKSITLGWSIEASEQYGGGSAGSGAIVLPSALSSAYGSQLNTGSSTFGAASSNQDNVGKIAFDTNIGKRAIHIEAAGFLRRFAFYNPLSEQKFNAIGGGFSVNGNIELFKNFRLIGNTFYSSGGGRYIFGQGPDLIIRGDGSPQLVRSYSTMDGFEYQATPKIMAYGYYGGAYFERAVAIDPANGNQIGFGYTGSPSNHNRTIQQGTFGLNYTFWRDPNYGAMQFMTQYSYLVRHAWHVAPGQPGSAQLNMLFLTFRYVLPGAPPQSK